MNELVPTMAPSPGTVLASRQPSDEVQQAGGGETVDFSYLDNIKSVSLFEVILIGKLNRSFSFCRK